MNNPEDKLENGNKLPTKYEDPIDLFILTYTSKLNPIFKSFGFTANGITTISFLFGLLACYLFYTKKYIFSAISYIISYFFDVMDGNYARTYNMMSEFGAKYDVVTDQIVVFLLFSLGVFFTKTKPKFFYFKPLAIIGTIVYYTLIWYYLSCQDTYYNEHKENKSTNNTLSHTYEGICINTNHLSIIKYFGTGSCNVIFVPFIIIMFIFVTKK